MFVRVMYKPRVEIPENVQPNNSKKKDRKKIYNTDIVMIMNWRRRQSSGGRTEYVNCY